MEMHAEPLADQSGDFVDFSILIAVLVGVITLVIYLIWRRCKLVGDSILLTGLSDAGKTLIYTRLVLSKFKKTYTSAKENAGNIVINNRTLRLVDIPGYERLRYKYFDQYKKSTKGIIYVIDSVTIQKDIRDVAEYLYNLLSDPAMQKNVSALILCNKQDQTMAKGATVVKALLEKEINLLRLTKTSQLESTDSSSANVFLGKQGKDFEFSHLDISIEFAECAAFNKDENTPADLDRLNNWLQKIS